MSLRKLVARNRRRSAARGGRNRGFTLVELLVVISIIGMLMALLLPAIQNARETGRQNTCRNNLSNLAKALFNYSNRNGSYPGYMNALQLQNGTAYVDPTTGTQTPVSWIVMVLPDIDRAQLFEAWRRPMNSSSSGGSANIVVNTKVYLELLACPSDPQPSRTGTPISYVVNTGQQDAAAAVTGTSTTGGMPRDWAANGMFFDNYTEHQLIKTTASSRGPMVYMRDEMVHDPKDKTILLTENVDAVNYTFDQSSSGGGGSWLTTEVGIGCIYAPGTVNSSVSPPTMDPTPSSSSGGGSSGGGSSGGGSTSVDNYRINVGTGRGDGISYEYCRPSSRHPQMVNVGFVGQNVQPLRDAISYFVYAKLMSSDDEGMKLPGTQTVCDPYLRQYQLTDTDINP